MQQKRDVNPSESFGRQAGRLKCSGSPALADYTSHLTIMSRYFAIFLLTLGLVPGLVESSTVVLDASFDAYVQQLLELLHVPGLSIAVVRRDSIESKVRFIFFQSSRVCRLTSIRGMAMQNYPTLRLQQTRCTTQAARPKPSQRRRRRSWYTITQIIQTLAGPAHFLRYFLVILLLKTTITLHT